MSQDDVETYHQDGSWYNREAGESRNTSGPFRSKEEAVEAGRRYGGRRRGEHHEHHGSDHHGADHDGPGDHGSARDTDRLE
ncbi:DUF2188 domain-containing protein [Herbiconiux sp. VKM Ac-2851]|uniref:DUF2188 domain-containing protein n=1 Tax=Herbiconiux sp. VKM Ac-2851 TaxID=2739025 RepID=UPI001563BDBE|nr:DUF2188 domain-containing protein [Herbiconiux sp. VKM Ac-2851]NQX33555.1 DUF2188 domain-containing protein [Herbiconiux sp. VKM Ac-2851]